MGRAATRTGIARVAAAGAAVAVATVVMTAGPADAAPQPSLSGGPCGATFEDGGPVTAIVHTYAEPLLSPRLRDTVHNLNCSLAYEGL